MRTSDESDTQARWRAWLKTVIRASGLKPTPFAIGAKLAPSTVTRGLADEDPGVITAKTIEKIMQHYNVPGPLGFEGAGTSGFAEPEVSPYEGPRKTNDPNLSQWVVHSRALELAGIIPGDIITVRTGLDPKPNQIVCVQIYDYELGTAETVMRRYEPPVLVTATLDPLAKANPERIDDKSVRIMGTVIRSEREYVRAA